MTPPHNGMKMLKESSEFLMQEFLYLYMHTKHKECIPLIEKAVREMKTDGTWHQIYQKVFKDTSK